MSADNPNSNKPADTHQPKRDHKGRFKDSGNPKGRPRKIDLTGAEADPYVFSKIKLELNINGQTVEVTRHEALMSKIYQMAMKGDVRAAIYIHTLMREGENDNKGALHIKFEELKDKLEMLPTNDYVMHDAVIKRMQMILDNEIATRTQIQALNKLHKKQRKHSRNRG